MVSTAVLIELLSYRLGLSQTFCYNLISLLWYCTFFLFLLFPGSQKHFRKQNHIQDGTNKRSRMLEHILEEHKLTFKYDQSWDSSNLESVLNVTGIWRTNCMAQHDIITSSQLYNHELWLNIWCISWMNTNSLPLDWRLQFPTCKKFCACYFQILPF